MDCIASISSSFSGDTRGFCPLLGLVLGFFFPAGRVVLTGSFAPLLWVSEFFGCAVQIPNRLEVYHINIKLRVLYYRRWTKYSNPFNHEDPFYPKAQWFEYLVHLL